MVPSTWLLLSFPFPSHNPILVCKCCSVQMPSTMMGTLRRILFSSCLLWTQIRSLNASFSCSSSHDCETALMDGSQCVSGFCTNPLHYGGCLHRMLPGWHKIRTCNSDDPPNAAIDGYCRVSPMGYREVRIESQEWLTAYFGAWILQILLGELLDVPVTIESGSPDVKLSLYDLESSYGSFSSSDFQAYRVASEVEDCTHVKNIGSEVYTLAPTSMLSTGLIIYWKTTWTWICKILVSSPQSDGPTIHCISRSVARFIRGFRWRKQSSETCNYIQTTVYLA